MHVVKRRSQVMDLSGRRDDYYLGLRMCEEACSGSVSLRATNGRLRFRSNDRSGVSCLLSVRYVFVLVRAPRLTPAFSPDAGVDATSRPVTLVTVRNSAAVVRG